MSTRRKNTRRSTNPKKENKTMNDATTAPATASKPKIRLLKFGSLTCGACESMARARTLERFRQKHPEVNVVDLLISDAKGNSPEGSDFAKNYKLSDDYGVQSLPTLIFEVENVGEVIRFDGAASLKQIEEAYDLLTTSAALATKIPW